MDRRHSRGRQRECRASYLLGSLAPRVRSGPDVSFSAGRAARILLRLSGRFAGLQIDHRELAALCFGCEREDALHVLLAGLQL